MISDGFIDDLWLTYGWFMVDLWLMCGWLMVVVRWSKPWKATANPPHRRHRLLPLSRVVYSLATFIIASIFPNFAFAANCSSRAEVELLLPPLRLHPPGRQPWCSWFMVVSWLMYGYGWCMVNMYGNICVKIRGKFIWINQPTSAT